MERGAGEEIEDAFATHGFQFEWLRSWIRMSPVVRGGAPDTVELGFGECSEWALHFHSFTVTV